MLQLCLKRFDPKRLSARMKNCAQFSKELYLKRMKHFAFLYKHDFGGSLNIFGKFAERFFSAEEIMTWQTEDPALIRRRGLMGW